MIGALLGFAAERVLTTILADLLQDDLPNASLAPFVLGFGTVLILLIGFALPAILRLGDTPPARVLRKDLLPAPTSALSRTVLPCWLLAVWSTGPCAIFRCCWLFWAEPRSRAWCFSGLAACSLPCCPKRTGRVGVAWRYGLANIARRGSESAVQIVAFGLGLMVLLVLTIVRNDLLLGWRATLDATASNQFVINIQPDEAQDLVELIGNGRAAKT